MEPLASKIRPQHLDEFVGQQHLVGEGKPFRIAIENKKVLSFVLWGPPGVGKTTLARIYAKALNVDYHELSAVSAGKEDIRRIMEKEGDLFGPKIIFLDEIHRFNKAQQDYLLPFVESGRLILIGATTENPSFEIIPALLSRLKVFVLHEMTDEDMRKILRRSKIKMDKSAEDLVIELANGDARQALSLIENANHLYKEVTETSIKESLQSKFLRYDKKGEEHYNTISAFIKSMRSSQPDAALYYLARMIEAGEDPKFIARRIFIFASEDIGMLDSNALLIAEAAFKATEVIGLPECGINLAHAVIYMSKAPKEKKVYEAYGEALSDASRFGNLSIPLSIRNAPTKLMKELGYGKGYERYTKKDLLPKELEGRIYYKHEEKNG